MTNINYEALARENGYNLSKSAGCRLGWFWFNTKATRQTSKGFYQSPEEAWKACCVENGLLSAKAEEE